MSEIDIKSKVAELLELREGERHILDRPKAELEELVRVAEAEAAKPEGVKYDKDKARWDLLPLKAVSSVVDVLTYGAKKYSPNNWMHVDNAHDRYFAAAMRHLVSRRGGELRDPETGFPHLAHAACCILFSLHFDVQTIEENPK